MDGRFQVDSGSPNLTYHWSKVWGALQIVCISGKDIEIRYDTTKPEGDRGRCADYTKAKTILGWEPRVSLESGIKFLYDWIENEIAKNI